MDSRGWNVKAEPVLMRVTATSSNSLAGWSRMTTSAVQPVSVPWTSTSRARTSTARTMARKGARSPGPHSEIHAPSAVAGLALTRGLESTTAGHIGGGVEQGVRFQHAQRPLDAARQPERAVQSLGGDARDAGELLRAQRAGLAGLHPGGDRPREAEAEQVHPQAYLVGDADQGRAGEVAEHQVGQQRS
ncbi:MAG TPA: hypothetical protein VNF47_03645 [Streptosporangiaceae bacterium]|nr:hypothetical protein [Streptosporangiaceae bacterium]